MPDPIETGEVASNHRHTDAHPAVLDKTEARQATRQRLNFRVLVVSLVICIVVGLAIYALLP